MMVFSALTGFYYGCYRMRETRNCKYMQLSTVLLNNIYFNRITYFHIKNLNFFLYFT